jgi:hypothetical protein
VRQGRGDVTGSWLAIIGMLGPLVLLAVLSVGAVIPEALREMLWPVLRKIASRSTIREDWTIDGIIMTITLGIAVLLFLVLRGLFRQLRRYATDARMATPIKSMVATFLLTGLVGVVVFGISSEQREARWLFAKLWGSIVHRDLSPAFPRPGIEQEQDTVNVKMWMSDIGDISRLRSNFFGRRNFGSLSFLDRFYSENDGTNREYIYCWMPVTRNYIYLGDGGGGAGRFRDRHGYLWIEDFSLEQGVLKVDYQFPVWKERSWSTYLDSQWSQKLIQKNKDLLAKREECIRSEYGVEPDTVYRVEIPFEEVAKQTMDKEFWQGAARVK